MPRSAERRPKGVRAQLRSCPYAECRRSARAERYDRPRQGRGMPQGGRSPGEPGTPHAEKSGDGAPQPAEGRNPWSEAALAAMPKAPKAPSTIDPRGTGLNWFVRGAVLCGSQSWGGARKAGLVSAHCGRLLIARGDAPPRGVGDLCQVKLWRATPRERTWLKGHQGVRRGRKASRHVVSARTQRDPERQNPGVVDLDGWVALWGVKTSGECVCLRQRRRYGTQVILWSGV